MPVFEVVHVRQGFVLKSSLGAGYGGIANALFELRQTAMVFRDAKPAPKGSADN
jgi:H+-translocating NAD(P) transhydrogenase subunit beta